MTTGARSDEPCADESPWYFTLTSSMSYLRACVSPSMLALVNEGGFRADVYGTQGLSECPFSQWEAVDPEAIQEELALPEGSIYRTRILEEDYVVVDQEGIATVVQDELQNTYQLTDLLD